jgi:peptidoglycan/xylan/chitin deacetylase (PgdA/CDA1 family)
MTWLHNEVYGCKETLENKLGVKIIAFAFPYGFHNEVVRKTAKEAGYEMQFTVYGRHMDINVPADQIGRHAVDSLKGDESQTIAIDNPAEVGGSSRGSTCSFRAPGSIFLRK